MRIAYVGNAASIHLRRWAGFFAQRGHEVHIISTTAHDGSVDPGITVHELLAPRRKGLLRLLSIAVRVPTMAGRLRRLLGQIRPDVTHVHYLNEAALWATLTGAQPLVVTAWGSDLVVATRESVLRRVAMRYVLSRVDLATCDAEHMKERLIKHGTPPERAVIVFFGTDVERFHPRSRDLSFRQSHPDRRDPLIVSTRNLEPVYDIATLIRAIPEVVKRHPSAKFLIGGSGAQLEMLEGLVSELTIAKNVEFIGRQSQEQLTRLLASCDVYVSTALSDGGLAASTAEAMASGTPAVITDVEDNADWVTDGQTGRLVPPSAPDRLAKAICDLLAQPTLAAHMGLAGREVIVQRNNFAVEMGKVERMYADLAGASNGKVGGVAR